MMIGYIDVKILAATSTEHDHDPLSGKTLQLVTLSFRSAMSKNVAQDISQKANHKQDQDGHPAHSRKRNERCKETALEVTVRA